MTSHLQWARHVPRGWSVRPLRAVSDYVVSNVDKVPVDGEQVIRLCNYSDVYNNEFITQKLDFMVSTATEDEIRKFGLLVDDVIITKDSESWDDIGVPALVVETADDLVCGYHLALLRPRAPSLSGRFLLRCLQAKLLRLQLELAANGVTRFGLPKSDIGAMRLPVPPLATQVAIAEYLDGETARLDALVDAKQRLLDLLAEKRKSIIAAAVTRGLDPKVKLRDSGVPWLGEIPAHWSLAPLRYLLSFGPKNGISPPQAGSDGALSFSISAVRDGRVTIEGNEKFVVLDRSVASDYYLKSGDILLVRGNGNLSLVGTCGLVETAPNECTYPDILMLMRPGERVVAELLVAAINSPYMREQIEGIAQTTNGTYKLSGEDVRTLHLAVPPLDEQRAIVEHIARRTAKLDAVRAATERTVALLKERRAALITAAVTGQLHVGAAV